MARMVAIYIAILLRSLPLIQEGILTSLLKTVIGYLNVYSGPNRLGQDTIPGIVS